MLICDRISLTASPNFWDESARTFFVTLVKAKESFLASPNFPYVPLSSKELQENFQKCFAPKIYCMNLLLLHKANHVKNRPFKEEPLSLVMNHIDTQI